MFQGYILHNIAYKNTSLIIHCFTKEYGIVKLVANGARRCKSKFFGILQPFIPILLYWKQVETELATLYQAEAARAPYRLSGYYLLGALYINELLLKVFPAGDSDEELFQHYQDFLIKLNEASKASTNYNPLILQQSLRFLEKKILKAIGYDLNLSVETINGAKVDPAAQYYFEIETGLKKFNPSKDYLGAKLSLISGGSLLALHHDVLTNHIELHEAKLFMRYILALFLHGKSLATRKLFYK